MNDPKEVVKCFIEAMFEWERESATRRRIEKDLKDSDPAAARALGSKNDIERAALLREVFDKYCEPKVSSEKGSRLVSLTFSRPPEYQPNEEIGEVALLPDGRSAHVFTRRHSGFEEERRYRLKRHGQEWKVAGVDRLDEPDKWARAYL